MSDQKLTLKQEAFCQAYIECSGNASQAYRQVYSCKNSTDKSVWETASHLLAKPKIAARVAELQAQHQTRHEITVDKLTELLHADRELARQEKRPGDAINAVMSIAKLHGLVTDKKEVAGKIETRDVSDRELARWIAHTLERAAADLEREKPEDHPKLSPGMKETISLVANTDNVRLFNPASGKLEHA